MKPFFSIFKPIYIGLSLVSLWIVLCCAASLGWDSSHNLIAHSYSVWGDWSAHFTFISNLLERGPAFLWGDNPVFSQIPFQYPFLSHVMTALIAWCLRLSVIDATYYSSLTLLAALPFCLYFWFRALGLQIRSSFVSVLVFLFVGGFQYLDSSLSPTEPLTNQFQKGSIFTQFIVFELFPQRAFLFGLIAFTLLGAALLSRFNRDQISRKFWIGSCLALSAISWLHLHSWIAAAVILLAYFIFNPRPLVIKGSKIFIFGLSVALLSAGLLAFLLMRDHGNDLRTTWNYFQPGWAQNEKAGQTTAAEMSFISFWIYNTALYLPLSLIGFFVHRKNLALRPVFAAAVFTFFVATVFNLQPYFYDNLKLYTYSFLFFAPFFALAVEELFSRKFLVPAAFMIIGMQTWSGITDLQFLRAQSQSTTFFNAFEFTLANDFKALRQSPNDLILINPKHNHWAACLTGNPVVMGYPGWLWSWGINYSAREQEVQSILTGQPEMLELVKRLNVAYIVVKLNERINNQAINIEALKANYPLILAKNDWLIFSVKSPASSVR
jgi:hypothetical protein